MADLSSFSNMSFDPPKAQSSGGCATVLLVLVGLLVAVVVAPLVVVMVLWPLMQPRDQPGRSQAVGRALPRLELVKLTGGGDDRITLADLAGKVALVNFWGVWCPPCREELPHIAELYQHYSKRGDVAILAVSCPRGLNENMETLRKDTERHLQANRLDLPTYADPNQVTRLAFDELERFAGYPTTILIDREGIIRAVWVGYRPGVEREMRRQIDSLLAQ